MPQASVRQLQQAVRRMDSQNAELEGRLRVCSTDADCSDDSAGSHLRPKPAADLRSAQAAHPTAAAVAGAQAAATAAAGAHALAGADARVAADAAVLLAADAELLRTQLALQQGVAQLAVAVALDRVSPGETDTSTTNAALVAAAVAATAR